MDMQLDGINYLAVIVAVIINMAAGALWYSPLLFARPWMAFNNFTEESIREQGSPTRGYIVSIIASIVIALAIAFVANAAGADSPLEGLVIGLVAGVGFVATTAASNYTFEDKPLKLYLINIGYPVVALALIGLLIGAWQ